MATSGSTNFTLNRDQLATAALRKLRAIDAGDTAPANDITTTVQAMNLLLKSWQMEGIGLWLNQEAVLHLEEDAQSYSLGPSGDHFCALSDAAKTQLAAAVAAAGTALTVDSNSGIVASDYVGVELDSGVLYWSTQSGAPAGTTDLTLAAGVTTAAAVDNYVFGYTTKLPRPLEILELRLRDEDNNDTPITLVPSTNEFFSLTDKTSSGDAYRACYVPHITNGTLYVWPVCDNVGKRIVMTIRRVIEDLDSSTDDADMPVEVQRALVWNAALEIAPEYLPSVPAMVAQMAMKTYEELKRFYMRRDPVYFVPGSRRR